jgi:ribosome maturation factor RimP
MTGDLKSPVVLLTPKPRIMIDAIKIKELLAANLVSNGLFLVEVKVDAANNISVIADSPTGLSIDQCVEISRLIENSFDREVEDFALEVSSPGIGQPLKVIEQYHKIINRTIEVLLKSGVKRNAILKQVNPEGITIEFTAKEKAEGDKRPKMVTKTEMVLFTDIKSTKELIKF